MDSSLFDETFVVFEIDSIKDDPLLFPLVTLIIMDVFLQKSAHQEEPQSPCHRGSMESHRQPADGGVH